MPVAERLLEASWHRAWRAIGTKPQDDVFDALIAAYSEEQRRYHTLRHIGDCLEALEAVLELAQQPGPLELALWFHDAIYDATRSDNELRSARWATDALTASGADSQIAQAVCDLIMATRHQQAPQSHDQALLVDIDLAILGSSPVRFAQYERDIRTEYAWASDDRFQRARSDVLRAFLDREQIYVTSYFRDRLEARARTNLARALCAVSPKRASGDHPSACQGHVDS